MSLKPCFRKSSESRVADSDYSHVIFRLCFLVFLLEAHITVSLRCNIQDPDVINQMPTKSKWSPWIDLVSYIINSMLLKMHMLNLFLAYVEIWSSKHTWSSMRMNMMCGCFFCFSFVSSFWCRVWFWFGLDRWARRPSRLQKTLSTVRAAAAACILTTGALQGTKKNTLQHSECFCDHKRSEVKNVWVNTISHKHAIAEGLTVDHKTTFEMDLPTWL